MELVVLVLLLIIVMLILRRVDRFVYFIGALDILLRLITFLKDKLNIKEVSDFLNTYVPESIPDIISRYADGAFNYILIWVYFAFAVLLEYYLIKLVLNKR